MSPEVSATESMVEGDSAPENRGHPKGGGPERSLTMLLYIARNWSMEYRRIQWDRETLYKVVWEKSSVQVAKEFGISDVALAKICRKLKVPKPGPGYWRRKERGFQVRQPPLPAMKEVPRLVSRVPLNPKEAVEDRLPPELRALAAEEKSPDRRVPVLDGPALFHPLVEKSLAALRNGKPDEAGHLRPRAKICLDIRVTPALLDRAVRVMNAVIQGLILREHGVSVQTEDGSTTRASVNGEKIAFGLVEVVKRRKKELTPAQSRERQRNPYGYYPTEYVYLATGELSFQIKEGDVADARKSWSDGKRQKIEDCLNDIMFGFALAAERKVERRRAIERREQERREWEQLRYQKSQEIRAEEDRLKAFRQKVDNWHLSQRIRAYVDAVKCDALSAAGEISSELSGWMEWALGHADRIDPLRTGPPSILDEKPKYGPY